MICHNKEKNLGAVPLISMKCVHCDSSYLVFYWEITKFVIRIKTNFTKCVNLRFHLPDYIFFLNQNNLNSRYSSQNVNIYVILFFCKYGAMLEF